MTKKDAEYLAMRLNMYNVDIDCIRSIANYFHNRPGNFDKVAFVEAAIKNRTDSNLRSTVTSYGG